MYVIELKYTPRGLPSQQGYVHVFIMSLLFQHCDTPTHAELEHFFASYAMPIHLFSVECHVSIELPLSKAGGTADSLQTGVTANCLLYDLYEQCDPGLMAHRFIYSIVNDRYRSVYQDAVHERGASAVPLPM